MRRAVLKWRANRESLPIHHSNAAQYRDRKDCDVTRLVAMEHVPNKNSLLESFTLYCSSNILIDWQRQFDGTVAL